MDKRRMAVWIYNNEPLLFVALVLAATVLGIALALTLEYFGLV